jgi:EmrB/QacA subfamily drug resistance transporter
LPAVAAGGSGGELDPRRWRALGVCVCALYITLLDVSIVNVALVSIGKDTGAGPAQLQWVVSGYALAFGMVPIIGGRLGDDRGRRRMLLIGIAGFVVTSAAAGVAPSTGVLIGARLLQGLAGGLINPQVSGLAQQLFPPAERGRAVGMIGAAVGIGTASGPVIGGSLIALGGPHLGWRLTFLINLPVGVTAFVLCWRWLPAVRPSGRHRPLDLPGVALLALGMFGVLFPAVEYDASHDGRLGLLLGPAAVVLAGFVAWERGPARRGGHPLIDTKLFQIRSYAAGLGLAVLYFCAYTGLPLVLSLFLQDGLGYSALASGLTASAYAIGSAISAPVAGRLVPRLGRRLLVGALLLFSAGVLGLLAVALTVLGSVPDNRVWLYLAGPLLLAGCGGGSVITPNQTLSLAEVDVRGGSTAGGMLQTAQRLGAAIGTAVLGAVFYADAVGLGPEHGSRRSADYGHAYASALAVSLAFAAAALVLAVFDRRTTPAARVSPGPAGAATRG